MSEFIVELLGVTKRFPGVAANDGVSFGVRAGEIHAVIGENGAGKSTLMKILAGLYTPDEGVIRLRGEPVRLRGPRHAVRLGIGMVHQHFMLIPRFTVTENVVLGQEPACLGRLDLKKARATVQALCQRYHLDLDPDRRVSELSVGEQQRVEILKVLYRGADILILDEPTAVLAPQEVLELFRHLEELRAQRKTVLFISHKLDEVLAIANRVTVLRRGRVVGTLEAACATKEGLAEMMVGRPVFLKVRKPPVASLTDRRPLLTLEQVTRRERGRMAIDRISLQVMPGEIYGVAGVEGNGQAELARVVAGIIRPEQGRVLMLGADVTDLGVARRRRLGLAVIPDDRHRDGLVLPMSVWENALLGYHRDTRWRRRLLYDVDRLRAFTQKVVREFDVRTPSIDVTAASLSGGNQQKLVLARELSSNPRLILAAQPTRGLDVGASEFVWQQLLEARARGAGVLLISADLEELLALADRIGVLSRGRLTGELPVERATVQALGRLMLAGGEAA